MQIRIRFSLLTLFVLLTFATVILGIRYGQRRDLQYAAFEIEKSGGKVFFSWQDPYVVSVPIPFQRTIIGSVEEQVTTKKIQVDNLRTSYELRAIAFAPPRFSVFSFLIGSHNDVDIGAVSMPVVAVNDDTAKIFHRMQNLKIAVLCVGKDYSVKLSARSTPEKRREILLALGQDFERATKFLEDNFPTIALYQRGY